MYQLKLEVRKCFICNDYIEGRIVRHPKNDIVLYFHPTCFFKCYLKNLVTFKKYSQI
jgi:hypothetical protein